MLCAGPNGCLLTTQGLNSGEVLFVEPPMGWQPNKNTRPLLCMHCGSRPAALVTCKVCGQVASCQACCGLPCRMCPELKITRGHVAPFTLVALDLLRRREERALPDDAFVPPFEVRKEHRDGAL